MEHKRTNIQQINSIYVNLNLWIKTVSRLTRYLKERRCLTLLKVSLTLANVRTIQPFGVLAVGFGELPLKMLQGQNLL